MMATGGKYLIFQVQGRLYGLPILDVKEIIELGEITPLPGLPPAHRGVIDLRGKVIPVLDLALLFGGAGFHFEGNDSRMDGAQGHTSGAEGRLGWHRACIIVMEVQQGEELIEAGFIVEAMREVADIEEKAIEPVPSFSGERRAWAVDGVTKVRDRLVLLLSAGALLSGTHSDTWKGGETSVAMPSASTILEPERAKSTIQQRDIGQAMGLVQAI